MTAFDGSAPVPQLQHIIAELGLRVDVAGDELHGTATVRPEMFVPGTSGLRLSVLATWSDHIAGLMAAHAIAPRVPVTLDLDVHLFADPVGWDTVQATARPLKVGKAIVVVGVDFRAGGDAVATGTASFMAAPDVTLTMPSVTDSILLSQTPRPALSVPFAERAGCERAEPGLAVLPMTDESKNSSKTLNGGLLALAIEEAALSAAPDGTVLSSLTMRYLRPVRVGPAVASADVRAGLGVVTVHDAGADDRLAVSATTRAFTNPS